MFTAYLWLEEPQGIKSSLLRLNCKPQRTTSACCRCMQDSARILNQMIADLLAGSSTITIPSAVALSTTPGFSMAGQGQDVHDAPQGRRSPSIACSESKLQCVTPA